MCKKIMAVLFISAILLAGCQQTTSKGIIKPSASKLTMEYEELSDKEEYILNVTGNKVLMYNLKNFPQDKKYKIELIYEVYENGKKLTEDIITGTCRDETQEKIEDQTIVLNYEKDKINYLLGQNGGHSSGSYNIENKFESMSQSWLVNDIQLELGTEVYIYHANTGIKSGKTTSYSDITLGSPINKEELDKAVNQNEGNVLVKMVYKEVK